MIAWQEAQRAGLLSKIHWLPNLVAGLVVGIVALPLAMAFAIASGVRPEQGLYTAIIAGLAVSIFGGTRAQIAGPTGAFVVILASVTAQHGVAGLQIATLMAGVLLVIFGITRMGAIIKFIPSPVILGFTAGIGVIIWIGQWPYFFGVMQPTGTHFHEKLWHTLQSLPQLNIPSTLMGCSALIILLVWPRIRYLRRIPAPLFALILITLIQYFFHFNGVATVGSAFGDIPQGLPSFAIPALSFSSCLALIGPAFTIALLGAIESLLSAMVADNMMNTRHNSNQELIGQGIANIIAPLFGGFAATGAIARTATNIRNGGTSPLAGVIHALFLVLILIIAAPLAKHIPLTVLAAILFMVAYTMSDLSHCMDLLRRAPRSDMAIFIVTFLLTVFADLVIAVNIGIVLATLLFLRKMARSLDVKQMSAIELRHELREEGLSQLPDHIVVYAVEGPFFFAAVERFVRALEHTQKEPHILIIRLKWVPFMDYSALQSLERVLIRLSLQPIKVIVSGANPRVTATLTKAGIKQRLGEEYFFAHFEEALHYALEQSHLKKPILN